MADILDVGAIGVLVAAIFLVAVMMWVLAHMARRFEYLKMQKSRLLDAHTLDMIHRVLEWLWVGLMILFLLFLAQFRFLEVREFIIAVNSRLPSVVLVVLIFLGAAVAVRVTRRFAAYLRGELAEKPKSQAPPRALSLAEAIIRLFVYVAAAFFAYVGGLALLPPEDQAALASVLPRLQAPSTGTLLGFGIAAVAVFVAVRMVDAVFDDLARRRTKYSASVAEGFRTITKAAVLIVAGFLLAFLLLDLTLDSARLANLGIFLVALSLLLFVAAYTARDLLRSALSGLTLMLSDPFAVGDRIRIGGGPEVEVMMLRLTATVVKGAGGEMLHVPNADLVRQRIANVSRTTALGLEVTVRFPVDVPHARVEALLRKAAEGVDGLKTDPPVRVLARAIADGAMTYEVSGLVNSPSKKPEAESRVLFRIQELALTEGLTLL